MCQVCDERRTNLSRRRLLGAAGLALASAAVAGPLSSFPTLAQTAPNAIAPDVALARIMEGNARYAGNSPANKDFSAGRMARAEAQFPIAAIVGCADSRAAPELMFDQAPGELFVTRVAGNFVNDDGLASLEYGVKFLGVPLIMVLGHSGCGAVSATIKVVQEGVTLPGHLPGLVDALRPGVKAAIAQKPVDLLAAATIENVRYNVAQLQAAKPIVSEFVAAGKVKVVGGVYDIASGRVNLV
ncbi:MAG: carbonic anhydrase [Thalassobaculum sp.]